jgi:tetratricopeptide (TPR) repeat protein
MSIRNPKRVVPLLCLLMMAVGCRTSPSSKEATYLRRGEALHAKKDYPRALLEFRNAATAMPRDAEPHYRMGLTLLESGDPRSAIREFQRAIALNPKHTGAQLKLAEFMVASRDDKLVHEAVTRVVDAFGPSPNDPEAIDTLAMAEWTLGKQGDAAQRLEEALKRFPGHLQSSVNLARMKLSAKDWSGAEEVLRKAVSDAPQSSPAEVALGELYVSMQQPAKAEAEFAKAVRLDPKNGSALQELVAIQIAGKRMDEAERTIKQLAALPEKAYKPVHAQFLYQFGKREAALSEFEALAKSDPADRDARSRLVAAYASMNRVSAAENVLAAALKRNPQDTDALLQRAELRLRFGKTDDAENDLKTVIHFTPDSAPAHFALARAYQAKGLGKNQQEELQLALRLNPSLLPARLSLQLSFLSANQAKAALAVSGEAPDAQKKQLPWMIGNNWALLALGNLQEAKAGIERALKQDRPAEAVYQSAVLRLLQHDSEGARAQVEELLKRDVADVRVAQLLIETYAAQKNVGKGLDRLKEFVAKHSNSAPLQHLLGQWYSRSGNLAEARKAFEASTVADPHFVPANLSLAEQDIQEGRNDAARQRLNGIITTDSRNVAALMLLARADEAAGDRAAVITRYRAILNVDQSNLIALNNLAYSVALDDPDEALKFAQKAVEVAPDNAAIQDTLGWIYYRKGLYSMAVRCLKTAVDRESSPKRQFHLGMSYLKAGDQMAGQKFVREAMMKDPNLPNTEKGW